MSRVLLRYSITLTQHFYSTQSNRITLGNFTSDVLISLVSSFWSVTKWLGCSLPRTTIAFFDSVVVASLGHYSILVVTNVNFELPILPPSAYSTR